MLLVEQIANPLFEFFHRCEFIGEGFITQGFTGRGFITQMSIGEGSSLSQGSCCRFGCFEID